MEVTETKNEDQEEIDKWLVKSELLINSIGSHIDAGYISWEKFDAMLITWLKDGGLFEEKEDDIHAIKKINTLEKARIGMNLIYL